MDMRKSGLVSSSDSAAYSDLNRLNQLKVGDKNSDGNMRKVAQEFESLFLNEMLKSMRSATDALGQDNPLNTAAATIAGALVQQAQRLSTNPDDPDDNPPSQLISAKAHKAITNTATTALNATYSAMLSALSGAGRMVGSATQAVVNAALTPEGDDATPDDAATATGVAASVANAAPAPTSCSLPA